MATRKSTKTKKRAKPSKGEATEQRRTLRQDEMPAVPLEQALRIPQAIADHYGYRPSTPLAIAHALDMQPSSGTFRMRCKAAVTYGLTEGTAYAERISITPLGMRIVRPTQEGDDLSARREAFLRAPVINRFLSQYNGAAFPRPDIAQNVLHELGVPRERTAGVLELITEGADSLSFITEIKGRRHIDLSGVPVSRSSQSEVDRQTDEPEGVEPEQQAEEQGEVATAAQPVPIISLSPRQRRVYLTHGKNRDFIEPIRKLLAFGELEAVVSVERQSVSQPLTDKVVSEMRSCGAAIIHIDAEQRLIDQNGNEHVVLNPNVLIEIGAALALYGRRFILFVRDGITLPSNVQGLFEVRYTGETLDGDTTIRLLHAINDIKNHPLPELPN